MLMLDTNTISYYFRGDEHVVPKLQAVAPAEVSIPAIVVYELRYGLLRLDSKASATRLLALETLIKPLQILAFDQQCADGAAAIRATLEKRGEPIGPHDLQIAATALRYGATLVTRNVREFSRIKTLKVVNWHTED